MRLVFVLLEKLGESFFEVGVTQHRRKWKIGKNSLNPKSQFKFNIKFMGELKN
jgi:hypothetical protein